MAKKALLVGINYPGTQHALNGCINDVLTVSEILSSCYGFPTKDKRMLTDSSATTANILERLNWLVDGAQPGDVLFFHYSGHGSNFVDSKYDTDYEPDGLDELICPIDLDWRNNIITDDMLRQIFSKVPTGVNLTVVLDCCHSGGAIDSRYEYMPFGVAKPDVDPLSPNKSRMLPMPADIANRGIGLNLRPKPPVTRVTNTATLITGCQAQQTSADAWIHNKYMGAATFFMCHVLQEHNFNLTHKTLITKMNEYLTKYGYTQRPQLDVSDTKLFNTTFLGTI